MEKMIIKFLEKMGIKKYYREEKTGAICYHFRLVSTHYCLFTSCWHDFGLHIIHQYQKKRNGKVHEVQQKVIDFEKNLDRIERIFEPIIEYCKSRSKNGEIQ